jgi:hypothetical protein
MEPMAGQRGRLAMMERELAVLQARYEVAMSAFKFDEANTLQQKIAALEAKRRALAPTLPSPTLTPEPPTGIVPMLGKRPRRGRARRPR